MKTNPNDPANGFSTNASDAIGATLEYFAGLTKLEAFTMAAMQGLCASGNEVYQVNGGYVSGDSLGVDAVRIAKATIQALNEQTT